MSEHTTNELTTACPECGCKEYSELIELEGKVCNKCGQEWFSDIDYSKELT